MAIQETKFAKELVEVLEEHEDEGVEGDGRDKEGKEGDRIDDDDLSSEWSSRAGSPGKIGMGAGAAGQWKWGT